MDLIYDASTSRGKSQDELGSLRIKNGGGENRSPRIKVKGVNK